MLLVSYWQYILSLLFIFCFGVYVGKRKVLTEMRKELRRNGYKC